MRKFAVALALLFIPAISAMAADTPRFELFAGYDYLHTGFNETNLGIAGTTGNNLSGWNSSLTVNLNRRVGLVGDFTANYGKQFQTINSDPTIAGTAERPFPYTFLFGPRVYLGNNSRVRPFAEGMIGVIHAQEGLVGLDGTVNVDNNTAFAAAMGGGLDVRCRKHIEIRAVEADYLISHLLSTTQNNLRVSTGIVFRIGHVE